MKADFFLKLSGITGESVDAKFKDHIEILGLNWKISQQTDMQRGADGAIGRSDVGDVIITK